MFPLLAALDESIYRQQGVLMSEQVKINLNISTGEVCIEAPVDALESIFDRLESFLPRLVTESVNESQAKDGPPAQDEVTQEHVTDDNTESTSKPKQKTKVKKASPKANSTKPESYKTVDLGLSQDQRLEFKSFYEAKDPGNQSDHILVVIYWLIKNTNRTKLTIDEIFTGLRTVGEKVPKRITSVLSNLSLASYITKENNEPTLLHIGEDYIDHDLPKKKEK